MSVDWRVPDLVQRFDVDLLEPLYQVGVVQGVVVLAGVGHQEVAQIPNMQRVALHDRIHHRVVEHLVQVQLHQPPGGLVHLPLVAEDGPGGLAALDLFGGHETFTTFPRPQTGQVSVAPFWRACSQRRNGTGETAWHLEHFT